MKKLDLGLITALTLVALGAVGVANVAFGAGTAVAQAAPTASTTLAQAVRTAEQHTKGRAGKVELEREDGVYVYEVKTVSKDGVAEVSVDFATGKVGKVETDGIVDKVGNVFDSEDKREDEALLKALEAAPVTLTKAIDTAESETGGRAVKAKMKDSYGKMYYEVSLIVGGSKQKVQIDTATGKAVAVKARKGDDDDDDDDDDDKD